MAQGMPHTFTCSPSAAGSPGTLHPCPSTPRQRNPEWVTVVPTRPHPLIPAFHQETLKHSSNDPAARQVDVYPQRAPGSTDAFTQMLPTMGVSDRCIIKLCGVSIRSSPSSLFSLNHSFLSKHKQKGIIQIKKRPELFSSNKDLGIVIVLIL